MKNSLKYRIRDYNKTLQQDKAVFFSFENIADEEKFMTMVDKEDNKKTYDFLQCFGQDFNKTVFVFTKNNGTELLVGFDYVDTKSDMYTGLRYTPFE